LARSAKPFRSARTESSPRSCTIGMAPKTRSGEGGNNRHHEATGTQQLQTHLVDGCQQLLRLQTRRVHLLRELS
jgi:hypothetical protein